MGTIVSEQSVAFLQGWKV